MRRIVYLVREGELRMIRMHAKSYQTRQQNESSYEEW